MTDTRLMCECYIELSGRTVGRLYATRWEEALLVYDSLDGSIRRRRSLMATLLLSGLSLIVIGSLSSIYLIARRALIRCLTCKSVSSFFWTTDGLVDSLRDIDVALRAVALLCLYLKGIIGARIVQRQQALAG